MHVVITGASAGIGEALAREYAAAGAKLTLVARRQERLEAISRSLASAVHVVAADLSEPETCADWLPEAEGLQGPVDVLINNAGVQHIEPTAAMDVEAGEWLLKLNVFTPLRLTRAVLPGMIERRSGTLVNIASMAALAPTAGMTYYNTSKGGLRGELRGSGVGVLTVYPGIIMTDMGEKGLQKYEESFALRLQPRGDAATLARLVRSAQERDRPRLIYPRLNISARHFPGITRWLMNRVTPRLRG
jgi:short-subunit dehydrogenase